MKITDRIFKIIKIKTLNIRLWLIMFIMSFVLIVFFSILSYFSASSFMQKNALEFSKEILDMKALSIDQYIDHMEQYSQDVLYEPSVYDVLMFAKDMDTEGVFFEQAAKDILDEYGTDVINTFTKLIIAREEVQSIALIDNAGFMWLYENDDSSKGEIQSIIDPTLFEQISKIAKQAAGRQTIFLNTLDNKVSDIFFIRSIFSPNNYDQLGYLVLTADKQYFESIIQSEIKENAFNVMLYDSSGISIFNSGFEDYTDNIREFIDKDIVWRLNHDINVLFVRSDVSKVGWSLVSTQRLSVLFAALRKFRTLLFISSILLIAVFSCVAWFFSKDTLRPIKSITYAMKRVRNGEMGVDVIIDRDDELGYMGETFNKMIHENERLVKEIYREQITKKDIELQTLQSQINPHFLFNTLETISWMARLKNVEEISDMVGDLAAIMSVNMGKGDSFTSIENEIKHIDRYFSIMKKRFEERLKVIKQIDSSLFMYKIPKLLIQPLIENAIYHGIDKRRKGGCIYIGISKYMDNVKLTICDSGKGIKETEVKMINEQLSRSSDDYFYHLKENQRSNIGIENVNRRIKLYFGEEYGIEIISKFDHYTKVIAVLPLKGILEE